DALLDQRGGDRVGARARQLLVGIGVALFVGVAGQADLLDVVGLGEARLLGDHLLAFGGDGRAAGGEQHLLRRAPAPADVVGWAAVPAGLGLRGEAGDEQRRDESGEDQLAHGWLPGWMPLNAR